MRSIVGSTLAKARWVATLARLELRRSTGGKSLYLAGGCLVWFVITALWNALARENPMEGTSVLNGVLALPNVLLAFFLGSQLVASDQENRSLEVVLSLPRGKTFVWLMRVAVAIGFVGGISLLLTIGCWMFVAHFDFLEVWLQSLAPVAFFATLAFLLSVVMKSGTAAALVSSLVLGVMFITNGLWAQGALSYVYPFLNPHKEPDGVLPDAWVTTVTANRVGLSITIAVMLIGALVTMRKRERLL